jgi:hypothetical protein
MKSPYTAQIFLAPYRGRSYVDISGRTPDLELTWEANRDDLDAGTRIAYRFRSSGLGAGVGGTLIAATFFVGSLLDAGESAYIRVLDREGAQTGYDATADRDDKSRFRSTLGSRVGNERIFQGV